MKYKTAFVSDFHLGTPVSQVDKILDFLKNNEFEKIYLIGDIIDMIAMKKHFLWNTNHNTVIQKILRLARKNSEIVYIYGNHDYFLELFNSEIFGNIKITEREIYTTVSGKKMLIFHGHQMDGIIKDMTWLYNLGDSAYTFALSLNSIVNKLRSLFGLKYWSLSMYLKSKVKNIIKFVNNFEKLVVEEAEKSKVDIVVCGHIHMSADKEIGNIRYINTGCWTETCSALVEHFDGTLELIDNI